MTFAIETHALRKSFGQKTAVANLTLEVKQGEIFGFLGPNGAGKTTSVKMLLGLIQPTSGQAQLLGKPIGNRQTRVEVGFLPEHFRFHEWLTAAEFLNLHGRLYQIPKGDRQQIIPDLLQLVGLADRAQTQLHAFSKGMLQRIGLAQSLLNSPKLIFLDEPTSGLDPLGRRLVRDIINNLRQEGTTVFLNSHLLSEVEQTCDRVAFIRDGVILQSLDLNTFHPEKVELILRVGQPSRLLFDSLKQWDEHVEFSEANGRYQLTLSHERLLPQLAQWLIKNNHTLYEFTPKKLSLEELFLTIVGEGVMG